VDIPSLYAIADATALSRAGFDLAGGAVRMLRAGARWVQLRGKDLPTDRLYRAAVEVREEADRLGARVVVNDRADVALAAGAHGVHLGQGDLDPRQARDLLGPGAILGWSTHGLAQGLEARRLPVDYVAVGPVSSTASKERPDPIVPPTLLPALLGVLGKERPLVAIGGIRSETAPLHLARGAASVAVIGDLLREGDPALGVRRFLEALSPGGPPP
jgi:thiamine-phosphate pyrophosphorylase